MRYHLITFCCLLLTVGCEPKKQSSKTVEATKGLAATYAETYRPQYHFSPPTGWMNDPNGLVYHNGVYHLFYQYYPYATVWGPMHWGHAISKDLVHWRNRPVALAPDGNGFIFSGSVVVDSDNSSGFGQNNQIPLVAIYTYFSLEDEKLGIAETQTQGIAYSLDDGETWQKYKGNPVIQNTGLKDFRDPKVFWHQETQSWMMVLAAGDHAKFYRSKNLKKWDNVGDFGFDQGSHGGVWECPDLFPLTVEGSGEEKWVLLVSIGSGAPNGGSGTQYFVGDFDGVTFSTDQVEYQWLDWGTDNYAGVTYNQTPANERIFIGWMSNWQYALKTPTDPWRSAMTLPRRLTLTQRNGMYLLRQVPVAKLPKEELQAIGDLIEIAPNGSKEVEYGLLGQSRVQMRLPQRDFKLEFSNNANEKLNIIYDSVSHLMMVDRTRSGETDFQYEFGNKLHYMPIKVENNGPLDIELFFDRSSLELFVDKGTHVMTTQLFPLQPYTKIKWINLDEEPLLVENLNISAVPSVWP